MPKNWQKLKKKAMFNLPRFRVHNQFITITRTMYIYYLKIYPKQCRFKMMISFYQMVHHHHPPRVPRVAGIMQWLEVLSLFFNVSTQVAEDLAIGRTTHFGFCLNVKRREKYGQFLELNRQSLVFSSNKRFMLDEMIYSETHEFFWNLKFLGLFSFYANFK